MKEVMKKIFKGFDVKAAKQVFQEIDGYLADSESPQIMTFNAFVNKMFDEGHYGHGNILFLERMIKQIEAFGDYFSDEGQYEDILFIDIETLDAYTDWLLKLIWHLDGWQLAPKRNILNQEIADIQGKIFYFMANIILHVGSIRKFLGANLLGDAISSYLVATGQVKIFHEGTLEDLKELLARFSKTQK